MLAKVDETEIKLTQKGRIMWTLTSVLIGFFMGAIPVTVLSGVMLTREKSYSGETLESLFADHYINETHLIKHFAHTPTNPPYGNASSGAHRGRKLVSESDIVQIGNMAGAAFNLLKGSSSFNTGKWSGAVAEEYADSWSALGGFSNVYTKLPETSCKNGWGMTTVDVQLAFTFDWNGQFVKNAKVLASGSVMFMFHSSVDVSVAEVTNVGSESTPIAELHYQVSVSGGNFLNSGTRTYYVRMDGDGYWKWDYTGSVC